MPRNPATGKIAPQVRKLKVRPYETHEIRKLIDAALPQFGGVRWIIALALGLRQGELLALHWSDVDLEVGNVTPDDPSGGAFPLVTAEAARFELAIRLTPKPA